MMEIFYCLNFFNSYTSKNKLKEHEEVCNNHNSCRIEMCKWIEKILKYNTEDCIEKLCKKLKKRAMKITNYEKKK